MKIIFSLYLFVFSLAAFAVEPDVSRLQSLLDLDRFEAYTEAWASTMHGRGKTQIADAIKKLTAEEILAMNLSPEKLRDAAKYDELILGILTKNHPALNATAADVNWGYNFFKNKLNDAYSVSTVRTRPGDSPVPLSPAEAPVARPIDVPALAADEVLLDVGGYASDRTTRAVFWEASASQRRIELHVGTAGDFQESLALRGTRIIGEVDTKARNYNPIYLVQDPGEVGYHYAITEISGADRVRHFQLQSALVRWRQPGGALSNPPPVAVVGDAVAHLANEERTLTQVLRNIPRADHTVIGQKGAFERTFGSLGKIRAILSMNQRDRSAITAAFSANELKIIDKAAEAGDDMTEFVMKYASDIDKLYEKATPLLTRNNLLAPAFNVFNYDRGSYEMSDYLMTGADGKVQRWRVFSNVWGDEVLPIARALKANNFNNINYMGTAGALPGSGLGVGDLVTPSSAIGRDGLTYTITRDADINPAGVRTVPSVVNVQTPFEETRDWLTRASAAGQVVEVETGYLASVFNEPTDRVNVMLLVSDVVGSEDETLASASSSSRRKAQISAISEIIEEADVVGTSVAPASAAGVPQWIKEIAPSRDPVSVLQITREAQLRGITTRDALETFMKTQKSFTTAKVEAVLEGADFRMARILREIKEAGIMPQLSVINSFLDGRFNPSVTKGVDIFLKAPNAASETKLKEIIQRLSAADPEFAKYLKITVSTSAPGAAYINIPGVMNESIPTLSSLYEDGLLRFGGLAVTENANGGLKFVKVGEPTLSGQLTTTAFFPPDESTRNILTVLNGNEAQITKTLDDALANINASSGTWNYEVRRTTVPSLAGGSMAQIVPVLDEDARKLIIEVRFTPEGLKNPAVVAEEILHLGQITNNQSYGSSISAAFSHPYEWAETVANARAGSIRSIEKLTRLEVEAATAMTGFFDGNMGMFAEGTEKSQLDEFAQARLADAQSRYTPVAAAAKTEIRNQEAAFARMRSTFDELERQGTKFNDLVMANDRAGVKRMLETYLPWNLMEPSEQNAWREWLNAMVETDPARRQLVFRGMDDYPVLRTPGSDRVGMFSTVLAKNQGNYTRRLRSLTTLRQRFGVYQTYNYDPVSGKQLPSGNNPSLLVEMQGHAGSPQGSPFLSVSDNDIATRFGSNERIALLIDERRMIPNAMAFGFDEKERLIPLVIFPDEVVYYQGRTPGVATTPIDDTQFRATVEQRLGRPITPEELVYQRSTPDFLQDGYERIRPLLLDATQLPTITPAPAVCAIGTPCDCVYKTLDGLLK